MQLIEIKFYHIVNIMSLFHTIKCIGQFSIKLLKSKTILWRNTHLITSSGHLNLWFKFVY